ncbi:LacI family DNA-binding transcriptional regulator [Faecalicatena orotica]|uniref:LacI family transcriptional regulator n=1 Tax=Faecalicatena orotica TaxID=1544 RepID=A0A2Y9BBF1_9FIRM|nr:LacI family DNA-binding transcriptional regulator [Faecalicatena orotica]PWJ30276.1 LacI family transcriptional regulator [Faecalicatena orotica]SSA55265.1 transcriptional regulator, LacI family [Faecalicatena orotica]
MSTQEPAGKQANSGRTNNRSTRNTSIDVAKLAGVSQATVSRAFNPSSKMSPETRRKVLDAAEALKYAPDAIARSLISNSTNIVAVIMQNPMNPFYAKALTKLSIQLRSFGKQILYFYLDDPDNLHEIINQVLQYRVDGVIITSVSLTSNLADICFDFGVPVVLFNRHTNSPQVQAVCCDNIQAGRDCADYFFMKGYRKFAFIGGYDKVSTSHDRKTGFLARLKERGIQNAKVYHSEFAYEAGQEAFRHLIKDMGTPPEAIFCASDLICAGVMDSARFEYHYRIPEDIAMIGFDDIQLASYASYNMTSFVQPMDEMIAKICELIMAPEKNNIQPNLTLFPCTLITRSTA